MSGFEQEEPTMSEDKKSEAQRKTEQDAARQAAAKQETQSRPAPGERRFDGTLQPGVVPTSGATVENTGLGQHAYTEPPPMARRRFYEDPRPVGAASEQQVLQGRGAPPPYPPDAQADRMWEPRRYPDQAATLRPSDTPQPSEAEASGAMTFANFLALPIEQQDKLLAEGRKGFPHAAPQFRPTSEYLAEEDRKREENERIRREEAHRPVPSMAPATPGTVTT
jgi:hypothetical protein